MTRSSWWSLPSCRSLRCTGNDLSLRLFLLRPTEKDTKSNEQEVDHQESAVASFMERPETTCLRQSQCWTGWGCLLTCTWKDAVCLEGAYALEVTSVSLVGSEL